MKTFLLLLTLTTTAFAQSDFLTPAQAQKVNTYMDNICPDTYCGGDISFYTHGLTCNGNSCTLELTGSGSSEFDNASIKTAANTSKITSEFKNVVINFGAMSVFSYDEDGFEDASFKFSCTMNDLPLDITDYRAKKDLVYELVVWGCIRELESTVYDWQ